MSWFWRGYLNLNDIIIQGYFTSKNVSRLADLNSNIILWKTCFVLTFPNSHFFAISIHSYLLNVLFEFQQLRIFLNHLLYVILKITLWENANTKLSLLICKHSILNVTNLRKFQTTYGNSVMILACLVQTLDHICEKKFNLCLWPPK